MNARAYHKLGPLASPGAATKSSWVPALLCLLTHCVIF
jgi:hypothetical protein